MIVAFKVLLDIMRTEEINFEREETEVSQAGRKLYLV